MSDLSFERQLQPELLGLIWILSDDTCPDIHGTFRTNDDDLVSF